MMIIIDKMKFSILIVCFIFASFSMANSVDMVKTYIVYKKGYTDTQLGFMKNYGYSLKQTEEFRQTRLLPCQNTNYYLLQFTSLTKTQNDVIVQGLQNGFIKCIQEQFLFVTREGKVDIDRKDYPYDEELNRTWNVEDSTP